MIVVTCWPVNKYIIRSNSNEVACTWLTEWFICCLYYTRCYLYSQRVDICEPECIQPMYKKDMFSYNAQCSNLDHIIGNIQSKQKTFITISFSLHCHFSKSIGIVVKQAHYPMDLWMYMYIWFYVYILTQLTWFSQPF